MDDKQGKEDFSNLTNDQKISSEKSNLADDQKVAVNETNSADDQEIVNENEVLKAKIKDKENTGNQTSQMKDVINEEAFEVNTVSDSVVYEGIVDEKSTDIEYTVTSSGLKENIIINSKQDSYEYVFNMNAENLKLELKDNEIKALDSKTGKVIYVIPAPFMYDANNQMSMDVNYSLEKKETGYQLTVTAEKEWINGEDIMFPVTVDPVISTKVTEGAVSSTFIASKMPTTNFDEYKMLLTGVDSYSYNTTRTLIKFQLPQLGNGDIIQSAILNLSQYAVDAYSANTPTMAVNAYRITNTWDDQTVTWNTKPAYDTNEVDYSYIKKEDGTKLLTKSFDITKAVKQWYDGDVSNYGIMLRTDKEGTQDTVDSIYAKYYSEKYDTPTDAYPIIVLSYRNTKGIEDYYSYTELGARSAGTAYVSDYTGNLYFEQNGVATSGLKMPANVYLTYNSNNSHKDKFNTSLKSGWGWKLNVEQFIETTAYPDYPYVYTDEDGTEHYFKKVMKDSKVTYQDEDGLGLTLKRNADETYTITDMLDTVMSFTKYGNLLSIKDVNGNTMTLTYSGGILQSVTDGAGKKITISNTSGNLTKITDPAGRETIYTINGDGFLTKVTNPDGTFNTYAYAQKDVLTSVIDPEGYELKFDYFPKEKGRRVKKVTESGKGTLGQSIGFDYSRYNTTKIRTSGVDNVYGNVDDLFTTYQFDNYGRLISTQAKTEEKQLGTTLTGYTSVASDDSDIKKANRVTSNFGMGANVNNLLINHNMETTSNWELLKTGTSTETVGNSTVRYIGGKSLKIGVSGATSSSNVRYRQMLSNEVVIPKKKYTFSGYIRTTGLNPIIKDTYGAVLIVYCYKADGTTESFYSDYISSTSDTQINDGWRRESVTFTVPEDTTKTSVNLVLKGANGNAYFDALQLEEGDTANSYNLLENGSFENATTLYGYDTSNLTLESGMDMPAVVNYFDGKKAFKIQGEKEKDKQLSQEVAISGAETDTYIISGWAKAFSVPALLQDKSSNVNRRFKISVKVTYSDGSYVWKNAAEFNPDTVDWQYSAVAINLSDNTSTIKTPVSLSIHPRYDNQANEVIFDNLSVIKDEVPSYTYDSEGNLVSVVDNANQKSTMDYLNNNLIFASDAKGYDYSYTYDDNHNMKQAKSQRGVTYNYTYNSSGNPTKLVIQNMESSSSNMQIQTDMTYTTDGAYVNKVKDQDGNETSNSYDTNKGLLNSVTNAKGNTINYTYNDENDKLTKVAGEVSITGEGDKQTVFNSYEYNKDTLTKIIHNGFDYNFFYDTFGNSTSIKVGDQTLASYEYKGNNGDLTKITYGNGDTKTFTYDSYGNVIGEANNETPVYKWYADSLGTITKHEDLKNQLLYNYEYDITGRLIRQDVVDTSKASSSQRNAYLLEYGYDLNNNITKIVNKAGSRTLTNTYDYTKDNLPTTYTMPTGKAVTYSYDSLNRMNQYEIGTTTPITVDYTYYLSKRNEPDQTTFRTTKVYSETVGGQLTKYSYDELGNITAVSERLSDGSYKLKNSYEYDELNQLVRENDANQNITKVYTYDLGGNIINRKEYAYTTGTLGEVLKTVTYEYADTNWKDKLTSYNGNAITYDAIGNPTSYQGYDMEWSNGRELTSLSGNGVNATYSYDADGLRTTKTVNGITTTYEYVNGQLFYEKKGNTELHYLYDANGSIKGIQVVDESGNVSTYYVVTNTRGDVTQIYNEAGEVQALYNYDSWGKVLSIKDGNGNEITSETHIGKLNSLKYRGYYYDTETGHYYLQSRYYNPEWGRFINADGYVGEVGTLVSFNMFTYCLNNPVNLYDPSGEWGFAIPLLAGIAKAIGATIAAVASSPVVIAAAAAAVIVVVAYGAYKIYSNYKKSVITKSIKDKIDSKNKPKEKSTGRAKNKLKPDPNAKGDHTTFKRNSKTDEVTNYETWKTNPKNPKGFDSEKRFDGIGEPHRNPFTGEDLMPHVHDKTVPRNLRGPLPWEIPLKR